MGTGLRCEGARFKGDVRGKLFYTEGSGCLELAASGGSGCKYDSDLTNT